LEEAGKLVALEIKASSQVTTSDAIGIFVFRDGLKVSVRVTHPVLRRDLVMHLIHERSGSGAEAA
jgi:hypothetical protein